jgi:hypothetical protein
MEHVPLYGLRNVIRAYALVDDEDFEAVAVRRWHLMSAGYAANPERRLMHRILLGLEPGDRRTVDHINGDTLDNRRANLRICAHAENRQNHTHGGNRGSSSPYRGVSLDRVTRNREKVWKAQVMLNGHNHFLGRYATPEEAAEVAARFRAEHMPYSADAGFATAARG